MITQILIDMQAITAALVAMALVVLGMLLIGLGAFSLRMLRGPAMWVAAPSAPAVTGWTVEEWAPSPADPAVMSRRVIRWEAGR